MTASGDHSQDTVQEAVSADPNVSIRQIAMDTGISKSSVGRCMKKLNLHPYSYTMVQELTGDDDDRRLEFCEWIRQRVSTNDNFYKQIVFSDEAVFHVNGTVNRHNLHYWNVDNPHVKFERFQDRQSVTVWCMLSSTGVIDYNIDFQTMNGERYCQVLQDKVIPFFTQRRHSQKLYQQDGAPAHYSVAARKLLDDNMPGRWIGRRGPIEWPPRSPDLSVCDFFFWSALRDKVYTHRPTNKHQLARRIE